MRVPALKIPVFLLAVLLAGTPRLRGQVQAPVPDPPTADASFSSSLPPAPARPAFVPPDELRVQIRDITSIEGRRANQLFGVGLVTGLAGTGGKSAATRRAAENFLKRFDIVQAAVNTKSMALVTVTAELPPGYRPGETIRAVVSIADDATDLKGGTVMLTPLLGVDGQVYALAQGPILNSGFAVRGDGGSVQKNHPSTGYVQATVEQTVCPDASPCQSAFNLLLVNKDHETASRIASAINIVFPDHARALDAGTVNVLVPPNYRDRLNDFVVMVGNISVVPNIPARVVINQKTGTIVIGSRVRISRVVFANDNLIITTSENPAVSQPAPFSQGQTTVVPRTQITAVEEGGRYNLLSEGIDVGTFAAALNAMGVSPQDLITIFRTIESSGALHAELVIE